MLNSARCSQAMKTCIEPNLGWGQFEFCSVDDKSNIFLRKRWYPPARLHGVITQNTTILESRVESWIVSCSRQLRVESLQWGYEAGVWWSSAKKERNVHRWKPLPSNVTEDSSVRQWTVESWESGRKKRQRGRRPLNTEAEEPLPGNASENREGYSCAIVNCELWELAKLLRLIVDTSCTCPITNPNPVYSHTNRVTTWTKIITVITIQVRVLVCFATGQ
jgi:hypothetical protein